MGWGGGGIAGAVKARLRRASLLEDDDYRVLLDQTSVGAIALRLGSGSYAPLLKGFSLETMRRMELEFLLDVAILMEGVVFRHYMGSRDRRLLNLWLENFDIELFKNRFRVQLGARQWENRDTDKIPEMVSGFHLTLVDQKKLSEAATVKDLLGAVKNETLRASLAEAVPRGRDGSATLTGELQGTPFALGMILDRYYFNSLYMAVSTLPGDEGRMMRTLLGTRIDLMNLYWIYRGRRFFGMSPEEALTSITKVRYRLGFEILTKAAFADPGTWGSVLKGTPYDRVFAVDEENPSVREVEIERNIYQVLWAVVNRVFRAGSLGFHTVAAYLMLKEFEVRDLVAVIEAVRYGFDRDKFGLILIRPLDLSGVGRSGRRGGG